METQAFDEEELYAQFVAMTGETPAPAGARVVSRPNPRRKGRGRRKGRQEVDDIEVVEKPAKPTNMTPNIREMGLPRLKNAWKMELETESESEPETGSGEDEKDAKVREVVAEAEDGNEADTEAPVSLPPIHDGIRSKKGSKKKGGFRDKSKRRDQARRRARDRKVGKIVG